jgi:putative copper export protein
MGVWYPILFWLHMVALAAGGVAAFGLPIIGSQMRTATAESRPLLFKIMDRMSNVGRVAIALLIITGPVLFFYQWQGTAPSMTAFITKMVLVVLLLIVVILAGINGKRAEHGDMAAAKRSPVLGMTAAALFVLIILAAAFAFK